MKYIQMLVHDFLNHGKIQTSTKNLGTSRWFEVAMFNQTLTAHYHTLYWSS